MTLAEISIRRPTLMVSIVLAIMVVGAICLTRIGVDMFPDITIPAVSIMTPYRGAGPEEIETLITKPLEDEVSSCSGLDHLMSINQEGLSVVVAMFKLDVDVRRAEEQVREKLALLEAARAA
ncbi:MAG: efflux RND transporter permease subunit, partial [bacterium]